MGDVQTGTLRKSFMTTITRVHFFDTAYTTKPNAPAPHLKVHEAYGYLHRFGGNILVTFIKQTAPEPLWRTCVRYLFHCGHAHVVKGLVIPEEALVSHEDTSAQKVVSRIPIGTTISVTWRDVVYLANVYARPCHLMRTRGVLCDIRTDSIVVRAPQTTRLFPFPRRVHARDAVYMTIPISLIRSCTPAS